MIIFATKIVEATVEAILQKDDVGYAARLFPYRITTDGRYDKHYGVNFDSLVAERDKVRAFLGKGTCPFKAGEALRLIFHGKDYLYRTEVLDENGKRRAYVRKEQYA